MLDQLQALVWIRENIVDYRGNPSRVTAMGHSAGGASVGLLLVIPQAQGQFKYCRQHHCVVKVENCTMDLDISLEGLNFDFSSNRGHI